MNKSKVIDLMKSHRSIRKYKDEPISDETIQLLIEAAKSASSSSFIQCTSIIRVRNQEAKQKLSELAGGQPWVAKATEFFVLCGDYNRHSNLVENAQLGFEEQTLISAVDTALFGQNMLLAAESIGLGGLFIGGIRNNPLEVAELLQLPDHVFPFFGLCLGVPDQDPEVKPRLPNEVILHEDVYQEVDKNVIEEYDETIRAYYLSRSRNNKTMSWSDQISGKLKGESRPFMKDALNKKGWSLK